LLEIGKKIKHMIKLTIDSSQNIQTVKETFSIAFPYLKLEFFKNHHKNMAGSPKKDLFEPTLSLKELSKKYQKGFIHITEEMPVSELEKLFEAQFGLSAQVFRKSGKSWLETTRTDDWTLRHQNEEGKELSIFLRGW